MATNHVTIKLETVAYYVPSDAGYLLIEGADRLDFIQRQSTNDLNSLSPRHSVATVLTTPTARILDVLTLLVDAEETIGAVPLAGRVARTAQYLQGRIFFMDNVTVTDASRDYFQVYLEGRELGGFLRRLDVEPPALNEVVRTEVGDVPLRLIGQQGLAGLGVRLLADSTAEKTLVSWLENKGLESITPEEYDVFRVEAGQPKGGHELTQDFTPLEANLDSLVSTTKGCFTGQEVLARQITYDKITRRMVGLRLEDLVAPESRVIAEGRPAGVVTSVVHSPRFGSIALAVIKRPYHEPGSNVVISDGNGETKAEVCELPFGGSSHA